MKNLALPGNPRYQPQELQPIFGYDRLFGPVAEVEIATMKTLGEIGIIPTEEIILLTQGVRKRLLEITTSQVDKVEREVTKHDIRAWVMCAKEVLPTKLHRWVHVLLTSYDALDTARALQFLQAHQTVLRPRIQECVSLFADLTEKFANQAQTGRTHGQYALPITVGFWLATILDRILRNTCEMERYAGGLVGKISGAVGAYNAQVALGISKRCGEHTFEERVLEKLGLKPAPISSQILPPEPLAYYLFSCTMLSAALGQFGRDARQLMRSEIAELAESFEEAQVGSSTMAQKRNPLTFENLEGTWLKTQAEFQKVLLTLISEHQRDLVGSSVARDFPTIVVNLTHQLNALLRRNKQGTPFLLRIAINKDALERNLGLGAHLTLAEPLYIALQMYGYEGDAHELINRRAVPIAQENGKPLIETLEGLAEEEPEIQKALDNIPEEFHALFLSPETYVGNATEKALSIAAKAREFACD